jgi:hypothetical protein
MKKQLNVDLVQNELRGGSAFFPGYKAGETQEPATPPPLAPKPRRERPAEPMTLPRQASGAPAPTTSLAPVSQEKRPLIRRTFDLYEDQLNYLTKESLQERLAGKEGSMNAMVREALDEWIAKHRLAK